MGVGGWVVRARAAAALGGERAVCRCVVTLSSILLARSPQARDGGCRDRAHLVVVVGGDDEHGLTREARDIPVALSNSYICLYSPLGVTPRARSSSSITAFVLGTFSRPSTAAFTIGSAYDSSLVCSTGLRPAALPLAVAAAASRIAFASRAARLASLDSGCVAAARAATAESRFARDMPSTSCSIVRAQRSVSAFLPRKMRARRRVSDVPSPS